MVAVGPLLKCDRVSVSAASVFGTLPALGLAVPLGVLKAGGITFEPVSLCVHSRLSVHVRPRVSQNGNR